MTSISPIKLNIADKLEKDEKFRKRFFRIQAQDKIAMNIRKLRKKRKKLQADLAKEANMLQSSVSRIEQADYSKWSFTTLLRVADALGARLTVSFEPVEDVIDWYRKREAVATTDANQFVDIHVWNDAAKIFTESLAVTATDNPSRLPVPLYRDRAAKVNQPFRQASAQC